MGDGGNSLINIGDLGEPAKVLIEKISDAIGWVAEPYQMKRMARAEVEVEKIKAAAQFEISEVQQRGLVRMIQIEGVKQQNIEQITTGAIENLKEDADPKKIENDWIANFFEKCETTSDQEMQSLWAKILAGEANKPGSYSKRTVNCVASLDKAEAHQFTTLCRFGWMIGGVSPLVFDFENDIYKKNGLTFKDLNHLDSIGLLTFENLSGYVRRGLPQKFNVSYYGSIIKVELPDSANGTMTVGKVLLTQMGQELAPICGSTPIDGFVEHVKNHWKKQGYVV